MDELFQGMLESWGDDARRHAMMVHLPIVMSLAGVVLAILAAAAPRSNKTLRWLAIIWFAALFIASWFTMDSGHDAELGLGAGFTAEADADLAEHESMGDLVRWFAAGVTVLLLATLIEKRAVRITAGVLAAIAAIICAGWVAATAHYGGLLVYEHGLGIAKADADAPDAGEPGEDDGGRDAAAPDAPDIDPRIAFFRETVRPILEAKCWSCHNPVRAHRSGDLDMTAISSILSHETPGNGPALTPGKPDASAIIVAISYEDPFLEMPPRTNGQLPPEEVAALTRWVAEGAVWDVEPLGADGWAESPPPDAPDSADSADSADGADSPASSNGPDGGEGP